MLGDALPAGAQYELAATNPDSHVTLSRRQLLNLLGGMFLTACSARRSRAPKSRLLERQMEEVLAETRGAGMACAIAGPGRVRWSRGFGAADVEHQRAMLADTVLNVGSVSKTVTTTAIMQLWEQKRFGLQDDVARYLPFPLRNPHCPEVPITFEQLLTHRSSIRDNWPTLDPAYVCGDSPLGLGEWLKAYLTPGGAFWDVAANWHQWSPGTVDPPEPGGYANVGFGLLGYLVELLAQRPFSAFCKERIFAPLGMCHTGWFLREMDVCRHAIPYVRTTAAPMSTNGAALFRALTPAGIDLESLPAGTLVPRCLYTHANYPANSLATSANDLARFVATLLARGRAYGYRLLKPETLDVMFSGKHFGRHLGWSGRVLSGGHSIILHGGLDPGIATGIAFEPASGIGVVCLRNYEVSKDEIYRSMTLLLEAGRGLG